jgi:hypothetical protein
LDLTDAISAHVARAAATGLIIYGAMVLAVLEALPTMM